MSFAIQLRCVSLIMSGINNICRRFWRISDARNPNDRNRNRLLELFHRWLLGPSHYKITHTALQIQH